MTEDTNTLRRAADRLEPDIDLLIAGATARGRRLRRRRRVGAGIAAAAVVGVVAAGGVLVPSLLDGDSAAPDRSGFADGTSVAPDPSPETSPIPSESVKPDEPFKSPPPGSPDPSVRAKELPGLVTALFPGEVTDAAEATGQIINGGESHQVAHFRWNGFLVSVGAMSSGGGDPLARCQDSAGVGATCERREDGSALLTWQETGPAEDGGVTARGVSLYVQGWDVFAVAYNAADGKDSPLLADEPPFTHAQLQAIVDDPAWFD